MIVGIDYGSRLAGTTVICYQADNKVLFRQSSKKEDADRMIRSFVEENQVSTIAIDAPLSLPAVYSGKATGLIDFHYRRCDREAGAMSPLFLGGLTARAMQLVHELDPSIKIIEVYPKLMARRLGLQQFGYKKSLVSLEECVKIIAHNIQLNLHKEPANWHQLDALLAFIIGQNHDQKKVDSIGDPTEGLIYF